MNCKILPDGRLSLLSGIFLSQKALLRLYLYFIVFPSARLSNIALFLLPFFASASKE
jgi:hypothetical protein